MGDLGSTSAFYAARPRITINGQEESSLTGGLLTMLVEETSAGLYRCEVSFGNWGSYEGRVDFLYFDRKVLDFGKTLEIKVGQKDTEATIFAGKITALEAQFPPASTPSIVVLAEDRLQDLRMTRRTRTFEDVSDEDVFQQVASGHGLRTDLDVSGPTHKVIAQVNQSDLAFLRARARAIDAEIWIEDGTLHVQSRTKRDAGKVTLTYGQGLRELSIMADLAHQRTALTVSGWDVSAKEGIDHEATDAAVRSELDGSQESGGSVLQSALGERKEALVHLAPHSTEEARALAESYYRLAARRFITGRGTAEGDGRLRVGAKLELKGVGPLFEGDYDVIDVRHTFDASSGFRTRFEIERPGLGRA